ncbi:MAG: hypothetical protein QNJ32_14185 [Xenococcaceae cyanobacterium MO_167.B27]|nr:hypothetical protein [Xenococcaceae cyanobacterium MO_167.B27]
MTKEGYEYGISQVIKASLPLLTLISFAIALSLIKTSLDNMMKTTLGTSQGFCLSDKAD